MQGSSVDHLGTYLCFGMAPPCKALRAVLFLAPFAPAGHLEADQSRGPKRAQYPHDYTVYIIPFLLIKSQSLKPVRTLNSVGLSNIGYTFRVWQGQGLGWRISGHTDAGKYYPALTRHQVIRSCKAGPGQP